MSIELMEKAEQILAKANIPDRHTFYQIEKFIVGKEVTAQAQLWQIAREVKSRIETIDGLEKQLADAEDELEAFDLKIQRQDMYIRKLAEMDLTKSEFGSDKDPDPYEEELRQIEIQEHEINIRKLEREKQALVKSARKVQKKVGYITEEIECFVNAWTKVEAAVEGEVKPIDDIEAQKQMWGEKFLEEFNLRVLLGRSLDTEIVKTIMSLDDDTPVKRHVAALLVNLQDKMIAKNEKAKKAVEQSQPTAEVKAKTTGPKKRGGDKPTGRGQVVAEFGTKEV